MFPISLYSGKAIVVVTRRDHIVLYVNKERTYQNTALSKQKVKKVKLSP
jgi:hypothetical protein